MTPEQEARCQRIVQAKQALRVEMARIPFDLNTAGATRVAAWKALVDRAHKMLARDVAEHSRYEEMARELRACGGANVDELAKQLYGDKR